MRHYPQTFDGLGDFWSKIGKRAKKIVGKKIIHGLEEGGKRYGLTALAFAGTIATGGMAGPVLIPAAISAASSVAVTTIGVERQRKMREAAQRAAKAEALRLAGEPPLSDAELDQLPDYEFPPGTFVDVAGNPISLGGSSLTLGKVALVGGGVLVAGTLLWLILRKR